LRNNFDIHGDRRDAAAKSFVGRLFRVAFAIFHAPSYQAEHKSALAGDWAHLPIPKDVELLERLVAAGEKVTRLLDTNRDAHYVVESVLSTEHVRVLGSLRRDDGTQVRPGDLKVTLTYWGGGRGRWKPRPFTSNAIPNAQWDMAWGERTGDLYLNDDAYFSDVPEAVWTYQFGGYPVLKKWLGYRQADRRDGEPLTDEERLSFRQIVQRIAALLALGSELDALHQETAAGAFTAAASGSCDDGYMFYRRARRDGPEAALRIDNSGLFEEEEPSSSS
jgi:hypothetical protein